MGGGGDNSLDNVRYYKVKNGTISYSEDNELLAMVLIGAILTNANYTSGTNENITSVTPVMMLQFLSQVSGKDIYVKYVASIIIKDKEGKDFDSMDTMFGSIEGGKEAYLIPCTKEEFYDISWNPKDFQ